MPSTILLFIYSHIPSAFHWIS
uniref:Uncharacterized protein n=1 Tax=Lepeophtheirus salmonis TaxID=72036 RepID=A0A0K2TZP8_LEPSM